MLFLTANATPLMDFPRLSKEKGAAPWGIHGECPVGPTLMSRFRIQNHSREGYRWGAPSSPKTEGTVTHDEAEGDEAGISAIHGADVRPLEEDVGQALHPLNRLRGLNTPRDMDHVRTKGYMRPGKPSEGRGN